jgi:pycsar effector protein
MEQQELVQACKDELNLVLSFFPRVDAKTSVVLAVDTGMLGYLAAHLPALGSIRSWEFLAPACAIAALALSIWHLYRGAFPQLKGGNQSLVYFTEIARRTEAKFIDEFMAQQEQAYIKDVLGQVWRNSEILKEKFDHLKSSFTFLAVAILPWTIALADFAMRVPVSQASIGK